MFPKLDKDMNPNWNPTDLINETLKEYEGAFDYGETTYPSEPLLNNIKILLTKIRDIVPINFSYEPEVSPCGDIVFRTKKYFLIMNVRENGDVGIYGDRYDGIGDNPVVSMDDPIIEERLRTMIKENTTIPDVPYIEFQKKNGLGHTITLDISKYNDSDPHIEIQLENEDGDWGESIPWTILNMEDIQKLKTWLNENF